MERKQQLSQNIQRKIKDAYVIVPGYMVPYTRDAYWRWIKFPKNPMTKKTGAIFNILDTSNFWIDTDLKEETQLASKEGKAYPPITIIDDRYKL